MDDAILFWTQVGAIGQLVGAIATAAAVIVSLWVVQSDRRAQIKIWASLMVTFAGDGSPYEDVIVIRITNHGLRLVRVTTVGWRTGWWSSGPSWLRYKHAVQMFDRPVSQLSSPSPPFDLEPGREISLYLQPDTYTERPDLRDEFFNRKLPLASKGTPTKVCVHVSMVAAKAVTTRVRPTLEKFLATGVIEDGAAKANARADAQGVSRR
jgi:hypothetical protein